MTIPPKYEDVVAQLEVAREEALILKKGTQLIIQERDDLRQELERAKSRYDREVLGLNNEGDPIGGDPAGGYKNDLARVNSAFDELAACVGFSEARLDQTGDSPIDCANQLQQRLTVAEQRLTQVEGACDLAMSAIDDDERGANFVKIIQAIKDKAALKPAEEGEVS